MRKFKNLFKIISVSLIAALLFAAPVLASPTRTANPEIIFGDDNTNNAGEPFVLVASTILHGDEGVPLNPLIQLDFNKNVVNIVTNRNNVSGLHLVDAAGGSIPIEIIMPDDQLQTAVKRSIFLSPKELLQANTKYILAIDNTIIAKNGVYIETAYQFSFMTGNAVAEQSNALLESLGDNIVTYNSNLPLNENSVAGSSRVVSSTQSPLPSRDPAGPPISADLLVKLIAAVIILSFLFIIWGQIRRRSTKNQGNPAAS